VAAPPLDSPCNGPVTYPGDIKTLIKSSKGRGGPTLNTTCQTSISSKNGNTMIPFIIPFASNQDVVSQSVAVLIK